MGNFRSEMSLRDVNLQGVLDRYKNAEGHDIEKAQEDLRYQLGINGKLMEFKAGKAMIEEVMSRLKNGQIFKIDKKEGITTIQYREVDGKLSSFYITPEGITNNDNSYPGIEQVHSVKMVNGYMERTDASAQKDDNNVVREAKRRTETIVQGDKVVHSRSEVKQCTEIGKAYNHKIETARREEGNIVSIQREDRVNPQLSESGYLMKEDDESLTPRDAFQFGHDKIYKEKEEVPGFKDKEEDKVEEKDGMEKE